MTNQATISDDNNLKRSYRDVKFVVVIIDINNINNINGRNIAALQAL
jgi:hypothetical protein